MTSSRFERLADIHRAAFSEGSRAWSAAELGVLAAARGCVLVEAGEGGFALMRVVLDEAELLTIAVAPKARRRGVGAALLAAAEREACAFGAKSVYLEVAENNRAARALYIFSGYRSIGRRRGYYSGPPMVDALVLRKNLAD